MLFGYMDVNRLFQLVAVRRPLWFKKGNQDREEMQRLWAEVGEGMKTSGYIARLKWQNLRDTFRKEVTKLKRAREVGAKYIPTWKHFHQMGFVLELVDPESWQEWKQTNPVMYALSRGNANPAPSTSTTAVYYSQSDQQTLKISGIVSLHETEPGSSQHCYITDEPDVSVPVPIKLEEEALENPAEAMSPTCMDESFGTDTGEDEDYHFLLSLLPHLKQIPINRKLHVRQKLQQVIIDEMKD